MPRTFDAIIVGLGAMGSATLRALSRRGLRVLGLDRFAPPHDRGSSHGKSRIIREAYFEHPSYVPLVQRAYLLWEELERESGQPLMLRTGGLMIGPESGVLVAGALLSARTHGLVYERIDAAEIRRRVPAFHPDPDWVGVWEPRAGVLAPERCVAAFLDSARHHGAEVRTGESVKSWRVDGAGVAVVTARGVHRAAHVVLAVGAWMPRLIDPEPLRVAREAGLSLAIERQVQMWFEPIEPPAFAPERCPIAIWETAPGRFFYGFPAIDGLLKIARHRHGAAADPDQLDREVHDADTEAVRDFVARRMPKGAGPLRDAAVCMYTNTPDGDFVLDTHPACAAAFVVSACSGHGFKFAPTIGEIVSDKIVDGLTRFELARFRFARFAAVRGA